MITKIFSKDESVPDAKSLNRFLYESKIDISSKPCIKISCDDWSNEYFESTDGRFYKIEYSCGVYEELYKFDLKVDYQNNLRTCIIKTKVFDK